LLVQEVAAKYSGKVTFVSENFGSSKLAEKYGVKGYPAVFVDDVLVAPPREFGFFGEVQGSGRYAPWRNADNQAKFKADLTRMIDLILAGRKDVVSREHAGSTDTQEIAALPKFKLSDLSGKPIAEDQFAGRVVLVEFWATWCPPCRGTLEWLGELKRKYGDKIAVVALAVESPEEGIRKMAGSLSQEIRWAIADALAAQAFGDITAVPTMFLFDRSGKTAKVSFGAPPDLHDQFGKALEKLIQ
jgi:cytochrome c biogenesis protein CcmG/thiol:disulfide interchange protein DsbE